MGPERKKKVSDLGMEGGADSEDSEVPGVDPGFNTQFYSGGVLLSPRMFEVKLFNNIYTQTAWFDQNAKRTPLNSRSTFFGSSLSLFYGLSSRWNIGLDANLRSVLYSPPGSSPFQVLTFRDTDSSRTALATLGPKVKFTPFPRHRSLTLQSALWFPVAQNLEDRPNSFARFLDYDRFFWSMAAFYTKGLARDKLQFFGAVEAVSRLDKKGDGYSDMIIFNKAILSWFPDPRFTTYAMLEVAPTIPLAQNGFSGVYGQLGLGGKFIIRNQLIFDLMYTRFLAGVSAGAGETYNFGISYVGRLVK